VGWIVRDKEVARKRAHTLKLNGALRGSFLGSQSWKCLRNKGLSDLASERDAWVAAPSGHACRMRQRRAGAEVLSRSMRGLRTSKMIGHTVHVHRNPSYQVWREITSLQRKGKRCVDFVLSLGTDEHHRAVTDLYLGSALLLTDHKIKAKATSSKWVHRKMEKECDGN